MKYIRLPVANELRRPFTITAGLHEGFKPRRTIHHPITAEQTILEWIKARAAAGLPYLTGVVTTATYVWAWGSQKTADAGIEPVVVFSGEISTSSLAELSDREAKAMLEELAEKLGNVLGQERIYLAYRDDTWGLGAVPES